MPLWVEAGTPVARDCFAHFVRSPLLIAFAGTLYSSTQGFEEMEEVRFGVGKVNAAGRLEQGGAGVPMYFMLRCPRPRENPGND